MKRRTTTQPLITNPWYLALKYCLRSLEDVCGKVLDVGCGAGVMTKEIKRLRSELELVGIDNDGQAIKLAKKDNQEIVFNQGSVYHLPFKDNYFSATFSHHVLEHLKKPSQALAEIARVTKKEGMIYAAVPLEGNWSSIHAPFYKLPIYKKMRIKYLGHYQQYTFKRIKNLFKENGFEIVNYCWSGGFIMQVTNFFYYLLVSLFRIPPFFLTGNDLLEKRDSFYSRWGGITKRIFYLFVNLESLLIARVPQEIIHLTAKKL
ncbi:class I SAM-dependent methyltransferase [Patescibacteria group bacterium]